MKDGEVQVTLYRWAGRKWFWEIRSECEECDLAVHLIRELLNTELRGAPIQFEVKELARPCGRISQAWRLASARRSGQQSPGESGRGSLA